MLVNRRLRAPLAAVVALGVALAVAAPAEAARKRVAAPVVSVSPSSPSNQTSATFTWTEATAGATFTCTFDKVAVACGAAQSVTVTGLTATTHTFTVRASVSGWRSASASKSLVVDLTAPGAPTVSGVPTITRTPISPVFSSSAADVASYECSLDNDVFVACASGSPIAASPDGRHTLDVRALDSVGNASRATRATWIVDTFVAAPFVLSGPSERTTSTSASFTFGSHETDATFECALDGSVFAACTSGKVYTGLASSGPGVTHHFLVRATDSIGNQAVSADYSWTVLNSLNSWLIAFGPSGLPAPVSKVTTASIHFTVTGIGSVSGAPKLSCDVDGVPVVSCASPVTLSGLGDGSHALTVVADQGLATQNTAVFAWEVDSTPPDVPQLFGPPDRTNQTSVSIDVVPSKLDDVVTCTLDGVLVDPSCSLTQPVVAESLTVGTHTVVATELDAAGNANTASLTWTVDTVAPDVVSVTTPTSLTGVAAVVFSEDTAITTTSPGLALASGAPVASVQVCLDAANAVVECDAFDVRSVQVVPVSPLVPGQDYAVTVNAAGSEPSTDVAGNAAPVTSAPFRAALVQQETSPVVVQSWRKVTTAAAKGGSYLVEGRRGAAVSWSFSGTAFGAWLASGPTFGYAKVYVDGVLKGSFNQYSAVARFTSVHRVSGLAAGAHTVRVVATGVKGSRAAKGALVGVDAFSVGATVSKTPRLVAAWAGSAVPAASQGRRVLAGLVGETVSMTFAGTGIRWAHPTGPGFGIAAVYVDGVLKAKVDSWSAAAHEQVLWSSATLAPGQHTVRIAVLGTKRLASRGTVVGVDYLEAR
jgi:hypothetical protein